MDYEYNDDVNYPNEDWQIIIEFPNYSISNCGRTRNESTGRILKHSINQYGVVCVGFMNNGKQYHRSVALLVARSFLPQINGRFDTPINLDGFRNNNHVTNLVWRPRWFAVLYNRQFQYRYENPIQKEIKDLKTGKVYFNSFAACVENGLLESDLVMSIANNTFVWPTYQTFQIVE